MAERFQKIPGTQKISESYGVIDQNFERLDDELSAIEQRIESLDTLSPADRAKLDGIEEGAQVNQNAFAKVNDLEASNPSDAVTITGGTGITTTTNPNTKEVIITATGEATPGPHGSSHLEHGSDPIPYATETDGGLMSAEDKQKLTELEGLPQEIKKKTMPVFNVDGYGAFGAPHDDYSAIKAALDDAEAAGGGIVYFPGDEYMTGTTLSWTSDNIKLVGNGNTILRDHPDLGANRIIHLQGTPEKRIKNTKLEGIIFRNGAATTGNPTVGKDCVRAEYVECFMVRKCGFNEVQGNYGLVVKYTRDVKVINSKFHRWTYAGMLVSVECENVRVFDNEFDTATSTTTPQTYAFAAGGEALSEGDFFVRNMWVERNRIRNNPRWQGINSHGGENIWIRDNYIENCKTGIGVVLAPGYVTNTVLKNVYIEENQAVQGTGEDGSFGIVAGGVFASGTLYMAENINVRKNEVRGFGGVINPDQATVQIRFAMNVKVIENGIFEYGQYGLNFVGAIWGADVTRNRFVNCRGGATPSITAAMCIARSNAAIGVNVELNDIDADDVSKRPAYAITAEALFLSAQIKNNTARNVATGLYRIFNRMPVEHSTIPTNWLIQKYGDVIHDNSGKPRWYVTSPKIGYGSLNQDAIVTVDIEEGSRVATITGDVTGGYYTLPPGMNVVIPGAGEEGGELLARILKNDGTNLTLDTAASTTVSGAELKFQPLTISA